MFPMAMKDKGNIPFRWPGLPGGTRLHKALNQCGDLQGGKIHTLRVIS